MNQYLLDKIAVIKKAKPDIIKIDYDNIMHNIILETFKKRSIKIKKIEFDNEYLKIKYFQSSSFIQELEKNEYLETLDKDSTRIMISKKYLLREKDNFDVFSTGNGFQTIKIGEIEIDIISDTDSNSYRANLQYKLFDFLIQNTPNIYLEYLNVLNKTAKCTLRRYNNEIKIINSFASKLPEDLQL